jgi:DNA helicase-2/ATP-dependent DNA helicase PcrA
MSRFIEEIPKELLNGYDEIEQSKKETVYDWEYGPVKKMQTKSFNDKFSPEKQEFKFRTAESFLNSINKAKEPTNSVDFEKYKTGARVFHKKFGEGTINYVEKEGEDLKVDINFDKAGHKRLMAKFANLEII